MNTQPLRIEYCKGQWQSPVPEPVQALSVDNRSVLTTIAEMKLKPLSELRSFQVQTEATATAVPFVVTTTPKSAKADTPERLAEQLYDVRADAKIKTRMMGNHLSPEWQRRLFEQIDDLHDIECWEPGDVPLQKESFTTFLAAMLAIRPEVRPGLGLTHDGILFGSWGRKGDVLTIEFKPALRGRWTISMGEVRSATEAPIEDLNTFLAPFKPTHWWSRDGGQKDTL